ncbi:MAG: hypothetical protein HWE26_06740 [Alteromonadaceae bacterium]|nr:hypothetical protein [Alteromonadaceae bacterium]
MNKVVLRIPPHQNAKVVAILVGLSAVPFAFLMLVFTASAGANVPGQFLVMNIAMPIIYFIITYLFFGFACIVYNKIQPNTGGFEIEVADKVEHDA